MIPIRDSIPSRTTPVVNYAIIGVCSLVFFAQLAEPEAGPSLVEQYGMIPARVSNPEAEVSIPVAIKQVRTPRGVELVEVRQPAAPSAVPPLLTMLTCVFLHGGWMHFIGNMWFLYIFGDNVEDRYGHVGYLAFYLGCGVAASLAHYVSATGSSIPTIGASGAIAGVMGSYLVSYPHARVLTLVPLFFILQMMVIPAPVFLGIWFLIQLFQGAASITTVETAGVAWWAHAGGFAVGFVATKLLDHHGLNPRMEEKREQSHPVYRMRFHR